MIKTAFMMLAVVSMGLSFVSVARAQEPGAAKAGKETKEEVGAPAMSAFQPITIDPALVKKSMQSRSEYEELNRKILARQTKLYDETPAIKDLQAKMRDIQKKIDAILAEDQELNKLKEKFQSVSPEMPIGMKKAGPGDSAPAPSAPAKAPADKNP